MSEHESICSLIPDLRPRSQRPGHFVRKTLSFSKGERMHDFALRLFVYHYHLSLAP